MTKSELAAKIDHTLLKADATAEQIRKLCAEAAEYHFCSVCVNSGRAALAKECLRGTGVKLCVVVGFPLGCSVSKAAEAAAMAELGADEIDMVLNVGLAKDGDWDGVTADIARCAESLSNPDPQGDPGDLPADGGGDRPGLSVRKSRRGGFRQDLHGLLHRGSQGGGCGAHEKIRWGPERQSQRRNT